MEADSKVRPTLLQSVDVKVVAADTCERWHGVKNIFVSPSNFLM